MLQNQEILISHKQLTSVRDIEHPHPQTIKSLSIIHCNLVTLQGIQQYTSLLSLNLKYNNISNPSELLRIPNKSHLHCLNIEGNQIEYYSACTYLNMSKSGFNNLYQFNNKDYSRWVVKKNGRVPKMGKINAKLGSIQKQMQNCLKRTIRNNIKDKYRLLNDQVLPEGYGEEGSEGGLGGHTRDARDARDSREENQRTPFREISLSNVNMIRSVKGGQSSPQQKGKMAQLVIQPIQFGLQDQIIHLPLTQPTATFASQKQKQAMPFKGRGTTNFPTEITQICEPYFTDGTDGEDISDISNYISVNRLSIFRPRQTFQNKSIINEAIEDLGDQQVILAIQFHVASLMSKAFRGLMPRNMPLRKQF